MGKKKKILHLGAPQEKKGVSSVKPEEVPKKGEGTKD